MADLDIVIPVYNEGPNIVRVLDALDREVKTPFRILVCYDHDDDDTLEALKDYAGGTGIVTVKNTRPGPHGAVIAGFRASTAPAVLVFPADDDYNAGRLDAMVALMRQGSHIVCPSRFMPGGAMTGCPWPKSALVRCAALSLHHLARLPIRDASNGFRMFSRCVIDTIEIESSDGFTYSIELLVKAHRLGLSVAEVPVIWRERGADEGQSRFRVFRWLPAYARWYVYAYATTWLGRGPTTVPRRGAGEKA